MEYNFKGKIEELLEKERRTKKSLYDFLEMSMQGFDAMMKNNSFSAVRLAKVAEFFEVDISELYGAVSRKIETSGSFGEQVIQNMADNLDGMKNVLGEQLKVKDRQIDNLQRMNDGLQRMLESVLGKSEGVTEEPTTPEYVSFLGNLDSYIYKAAQEHGFDPAMVLQTLPHFTTNTELKLVAPRSQTVGIRH